MAPEKLRLEQSESYVGDDTWSWAIWLEGESPELDRISYVEYTLHPTFPKPVRRVSDRSTRFRLEAQGWGAFTIYATAKYKDDSSAVRLKHDLELHYPSGKASPA